MKALSLRDPWGTLWMADEKVCETRGRSTHYRGPLAIHISKTLHPEDAELATTEPFKGALARHNFHVVEDWQGVSHNLHLGKIVALTRIVDCIRSEDFARRYPHLDTRQERAFGNFDPERFLWIRGPVMRLPRPIPCRGALGLWDVPDDVATEIDRQLAAVTR